jgi:DNA-binding SARP family transcriptional activator
MSVVLSLLGAPIVERDSTPVHLPAKALAVLGYLAALHTPQTRDQLLATLWPESSDEAARKNLRNILWMLRRELGNDVLLSKAMSDCR